MWRLISLDCFCNNLTCKIYCQSIITNIFVVLFINLSNLLKGSNDFENDISISCSELPDHFQCTLNSSSFYYELLGARPAQFFCSVPLPNLVWWLVWLEVEPSDRRISNPGGQGANCNWFFVFPSLFWTPGFRGVGAKVLQPKFFPTALQECQSQNLKDSLRQCHYLVARFAIENH